MHDSEKGMSNEHGHCEIPPNHLFLNETPILGQLRSTFQKLARVDQFHNGENPRDTVEVSNFRPNGIFGPFLSKFRGFFG
jgi:hypothetical protein